MRRTHRGRLGLTIPQLATAGAAVVLLGIIVILLSPKRHLGEPAWRVICASHLKQIGQAMLLYANENGGTSADSFVTLLRTQDLVPDVFVCPKDDIEPAEDVDAFAADPGPRHCSYLYLGDRLPMPFNALPAEAILAYDRLDNHEGDSINILFGDGHAEFFALAARGKPTPAWWADVEAQIARGDRPVLLPTAATQPATRPTAR
jgi:prepilin-type processing-associated H-X9-DG protein